MEIIIDTKKDSPEEIRKAIEFLKTLVDSSSSSSQGFPSSDQSVAMAGIFGDDPAPTKKQDDEIRIIPY